MKTLVFLATLAAGIAANAQYDRPLSLWAETGGHGYLQRSFSDTGMVEMLPFELRGKVSSLEVAAGYTVTLFLREELDGPVSMKVTGPCRIDDLEAVPMMTFKGNWDDAIGSMHIAATEPAQKTSIGPAVVAELQP